jgi:hypothetical protein
MDGAAEPINEILRALNVFGLTWRANEISEDGPWRSQCPRTACRMYSGPDELPLTITRKGHLRCKHGCDPDELAGILIAAEAGSDPPGTTWAPVDLGPILAGERTEPEPSMLMRTDGRCLLYPGRAHALHAEPEALKTWLALRACAEQLDLNRPVLYLDFEDSAASIVQRLLNLEVTESAIASSLVYIRPDEPLANGAIRDLEQALKREPALAVIDGVTEAFSRQGLNPLDNGDVAKWLGVLPRRLTSTGTAVLLLDHVVKDRENRGRYAIGAQHKLAGVDVALSMRVLEPFARGREGLVSIKVEKDRPGRIREFAQDGHVALLRASSLADGGVAIVLEPPERKEGAFRPTVIMQRVSEAVEAEPGLQTRTIRSTVHGRAEVIDSALEFLVLDGHVEARKDGRAIRHYSLKPYREADDIELCPVSQPCPNGAPDTGEAPRVPCPPPLRDTDAGHEAGDDAERAERVSARNGNLA